MEAIVRFDDAELDTVRAGLREVENLPVAVVREIEEDIWRVILHVQDRQTRTFTLPVLVSIKQVVEEILFFSADPGAGDVWAVNIGPCLNAQRLVNEAIRHLAPDTDTLVKALAQQTLPIWPEGQQGALTVGLPTPAAVDAGCPHFDVVTVEAPEGGGVRFVELSSCKVRPEAVKGCTIALSKVHPVEALPILVCRWLLARQAPS